MDFINTVCMLVGLSFFSTGFGFFTLIRKQKNRSKLITATVHRYTEKTNKKGVVRYYPSFRFTEGMRTRVVPYQYGYKEKPFALEDEMEIYYEPTEELVIIKADKTNLHLTVLMFAVSAILFALAYFL